MRNILLALSLVLFSVPSIASEQTEQPTSDARRALDAWLVAFRSGDQEQLARFTQEYGWPSPLDDQLAFRKLTGGFDLLSIKKTDSTSIEFVVQESGRERRAAGRLNLSGNPLRVSNASFVLIPADTNWIGFDINQPTRDAVITNIGEALRKYYVFEDIANAMSEKLVERQKRGDYRSSNNGVVFSELLTTHLQEISNDKHLSLRFSPISIQTPTTNPQKDTAAREQYRKDMEQINCGFEKTEILPGNVGFIKFNNFAEPEVCGATASAAINRMKNVDALIIDLRTNEGGWPAMVTYIASYFFEKPIHLSDTFNRAKGTTKQWWTLAHVPGDRLIKQPVYVLTSARTFSAAEGFAYELQTLGRAKIVGETTGGGAHLICDEQINAQFTLIVPCERSINFITKTNWEAKGVKPDIEVPSEEALNKALASIAEVSD